MFTKIEPEPGESVTRRVFRELRGAIVQMQFQPGQPLSEQEVAKEMGVSRQPVREAFIKLSEAGLVTIRPQRGTFVVKISVKQVMDAQFVRQAVELAVARKAALELPPEVLAALHENVNAQRAAAATQNYDRFRELDETFHRTIALGIGCEYAWRVVEETKAQMDRVRYLSLPHATPMDRLIIQHGMIVEAFQARNPDLAETVVRLHMGEILTSLPELEKRFPELFENDAGPAAPSPFAAIGKETESRPRTPRRVKG